MAHSVFAPFYPSLRVNQQLLIRWVIVDMSFLKTNFLKKVLSFKCLDKLKQNIKCELKHLHKNSSQSSNGNKKFGAEMFKVDNKGTRVKPIDTALIS